MLGGSIDYYSRELATTVDGVSYFNREYKEFIVRVISGTILNLPIDREHILRQIFLYE